MEGRNVGIARTSEFQVHLIGRGGEIYLGGRIKSVEKTPGINKTMNGQKILSLVFLSLVFLIF